MLISSFHFPSEFRLLQSASTNLLQKRFANLVRYHKLKLDGIFSIETRNFQAESEAFLCLREGLAGQHEGGRPEACLRPIRTSRLRPDQYQ